jgi:hypothetical protein
MHQNSDRNQDTDKTPFDDHSSPRMSIRISEEKDFGSLIALLSISETGIDAVS